MGLSPREGTVMTTIRVPHTVEILDHDEELIRTHDLRITANFHRARLGTMIDPPEDSCAELVRTEMRIGRRWVPAWTTLDDLADQWLQSDEGQRQAAYEAYEDRIEAQERRGEDARDMMRSAA